MASLPSQTAAMWTLTPRQKSWISQIVNWALYWFYITKSAFKSVIQKVSSFFRYIFVCKRWWHHSGSHHNRTTATYCTVASVHYIWHQMQNNVTFRFHSVSISQHSGWAENERQRETRKRKICCCSGFFFCFFVFLHFYSGKQQKHPESTAEHKNLQPPERR